MYQVRGINGTVQGKFRVAAVSGLLTGLAANAPVFSLRFAPVGVAPQVTPAVRMLLAGVRLKSQIVTPGSAAGEFSFQAFFARGFTASDSGGTAFVPAGLNNLLSSISDSAISPITGVTDLRVAGSAALTPGTRTLDAAPFLVLPAAQVNAAPVSQSYNETIYEPSSDQRYGPNLQGQTNNVAANAEGIVVTTIAAFPTALTCRFIAELEWYEYTALASAAPSG